MKLTIGLFKESTSSSYWIDVDKIYVTPSIRKQSETQEQSALQKLKSEKYPLNKTSCCQMFDL